MDSFTHFITFCWVVLLLVNQVISLSFSLRCYYCISHLDEECFTNPQQKKFGFDCPPKFPHPHQHPLQNNFSSIVDEDNKEMILRFCSPAMIPCDIYKEVIPAQLRVKIDECYRCNDDLCNYEIHFTKESDTKPGTNLSTANMTSDANTVNLPNNNVNQSN